MLYVKILFVFLVFFIVDIKSFAISITDYSTITDNKQINLFVNDINNVVNLYSLSKYQQTLKALVDVIGSVREEQYKKIVTCFPKDYKSMFLVDSKDNMELDIDSFNDAVLFSVRYQDNMDSYLEINVLNDTQTIQDYKHLIKNPSLVRNLQNIELVKNNGYDALLTSYAQRKHYEQNIILKSDLLITLILVGQDDFVFADFFKEVDINKLEEYVLK